MILSGLIENYPGKASATGSDWLPLWVHSMDTAEIMIRLLEDWLPEQTVSVFNMEYSALEKLCRFIALTHDIGKLTPVFAAKILKPHPELRGKLEALGLPIGAPGDFPAAKCTPHARAGESVLRNFGCPSGVAAVIGSHHGKPQDSGAECARDIAVHGENYYISDQSRERWEALRKYYFNRALAEAGYRDATDIQALSHPAQVVMTGLLIMADWLASNEDYFPQFRFDDETTPPLYPARTSSAWEKLRLPGAWSPMRFIMDGAGFLENFGFRPNSVQTMMMNAANESAGGLFILEAQMGVGKTEAALAAAEILASRKGSGGIFFGLPTQATANGIFPRLVDWAEKQAAGTQQSIRLAHGMAELNQAYHSLFHGAANVNDDADPGERLLVHPWFNGRKQALLSNFVIGTVDQLLMSALKQRHVMLRHLGLVGKVVILDECHAYDAYMNQYLDRALNWLGAYYVPVIVLSATLPEQRRADLIEAYLNGRPEENDAGWRQQRAYPLLTYTEKNAVRQATVSQRTTQRRVIIQKLVSADFLSCLGEAFAAGGCCGVIVNTVNEAQRLAQEAERALPEAEVLLLHSRFIATDRAERESLLLRKAGRHSKQSDRSGLIVIGTQVLEQSLDIDFDMLITQLCPMDLLLQRLGRLHRHERQRPEVLSRPHCYILDLDRECDSGSLAVYGNWLLTRTRELLPEEISLPGDIPELVQETYREPGEDLLRDEAHLNAWETHKRSVEMKRRKADSYRVAPPKPDSSRRQKTINGWLKSELPADAVRGEAVVRDGEAGISVLVMRERADGRVSFLPWQESGMETDPGHMPDEELARRIARQKLTLPLRFSLYDREERTIRELEELNRRKLPEWQNSGWLNGELVLLLDEELHAELCGQRLRYTEKYGLHCERMDDGNAV